MDVTNTSLGYLFRGYSMAFQRGLSSKQIAEEFERMTLVVPSTTKDETYPWLGSWPKMREWLGERVVKQLAAHEYRIKNRRFESTVSVDRDDIEDDRYGIYTPMFAELGIAAAEWPGDLVYELIRQGHVELAYDGQPFFSATHEVGGETVSNYAGGSGEPWVLLDTTRAIKPFIFQRRRAPALERMDAVNDENVFMKGEYRYGAWARGNAGFGLWQLAAASRQALDATNFNSLMSGMMSLRNDEGSDLRVRPNLLLTTPANRALALALLRAERLENGATNTNFGAVELLVTNQLAT